VAMDSRVEYIEDYERAVVSNNILTKASNRVLSYRRYAVRRSAKKNKMFSLNSVSFFSLKRMSSSS
jgi:hypothetical protein